MAENSKIEWTTHTWNPWIGCTRVSPGCDHCYAEALAKRYGWAEWGAGKPRRRTSNANWRKPFTWNRAAIDGAPRPRVFPSLCDPFDNDIPEAWHYDLWATIDFTPNLDWLLLTKRIGNAAKIARRWPDNVWLGISVVNQEEADRDIPKLLAVPARVRFISYEPALGPFKPALSWLAPGGIDWIICGGESGPHARPMNPQWARDLRDICWRTKTAFFFKQWGEWAPAPEAADDSYEAHRACGGRDVHGWFDGAACELVGKKRAGRLLEGREWNEFPVQRMTDQKREQHG